MTKNIGLFSKDEMCDDSLKCKILFSGEKRFNVKINKW